MHLNLQSGSVYPEQATRVEGLPFDFAQGKCAPMLTCIWGRI